MPSATSPDTVPMSAATGRRRRLRLWEIEGGYHCSLVGTCLSPALAKQVIRRARVQLEPDAAEYHLHSLLVNEASRAGTIARFITKTLDDAFGGIVRRVGATPGEDELAALWDELCGKGEIAGAYWAFLTFAHVPAALRVRIFGEVHMLSHFMGGHNRGSAKALWLAERRAEQLAERLARQRRQAHETLACKEQRIELLENELASTREELARRMARAVRVRRASVAARRVDPGKLERRVLAARARLRQVEAENARLRQLVDLLSDNAGTILPPTSAPSVSPVDDGAERCLLYVGGRCSLLPHLRRHADARRLVLLHHDGGDEEGVNVLERLIGRAEAVFCPIDCVSHQACLMAKQLCRRLEKPFVPLRTGSGTCFLRAIDRWRGVEITDLARGVRA